MQEEDPFYQKLPFTLQQDQLQPQFVMFGTGLQQSAIAAHLSKMNEQKGLIIDVQKTYGSTLKTVTLKELHQLNSKTVPQRLYNFIVSQKYKQSNNKFFKQCMQKKAFRGYNIDIQPSFFFGNSITCQCLKQADMDKYMDFRLVNHILKYDKKQLFQVPLSKGKIFESKQLSLMQKKLLLTSLHTLIKLYHKHMNIQQDNNSTKQFDKGFGQVSQQLFKQFKDNQENYFLPFLQKITKKNKTIIDYMAYIICNYQYDYNKPIPTYAKDSYKLKYFISRFGKFIMSCGIYGDTPYLYVDNGIGDLPQAFSRISSIFGSVNILHPKIIQDCIQIKTNLSPHKPIKTKKVFYGQTFTDLYTQNNTISTQIQSYKDTENVLRILILCKKLGKELQCPALGYFFDVQSFQNPIYLFMFDQTSHTCPSQYILYQFQTVLSTLNHSQGQIDKQVSRKSQILIQKLKQIRGEQFESSITYFSSYIRTRNFLNKVEINENKQQKRVCLEGSSALDLDIYFQNFIKIVGKQQNYFRKKNPYQQEYQDEQQQYGTNHILSALESINVFDKQVQKPVNVGLVEQGIKSNPVEQQNGDNRQIVVEQQSCDDRQVVVEEQSCDKNQVKQRQQIEVDNNSEIKIIRQECQINKIRQDKRDSNKQ